MGRIIHVPESQHICTVKEIITAPDHGPSYLKNPSLSSWLTFYLWFWLIAPWALLAHVWPNLPPPLWPVGKFGWVEPGRKASDWQTTLSNSKRTPGEEEEEGEEGLPEEPEPTVERVWWSGLLHRRQMTHNVWAYLEKGKTRKWVALAAQLRSQ